MGLKEILNKSSKSNELVKFISEEEKKDFKINFSKF